MHVAVVDSEGRLTASGGDAERVVFHRSAAKPFQAVPLVDDKGDERFGLTSEELALCCSSHNGEPEHESLAQSILSEAGLGESDEDGGGRATPVVVLHVLDRLGVLDSIEDERLNAFRAPSVTNTLSEDVGVIREDFRLGRHG